MNHSSIFPVDAHFFNPHVVAYILFSWLLVSNPCLSLLGTIQNLHTFTNSFFYSTPPYIFLSSLFHFHFHVSLTRSCMPFFLSCLLMSEEYSMDFHYFQEIWSNNWVYTWYICGEWDNLVMIIVYIFSCNILCIFAFHNWIILHVLNVSLFASSFFSWRTYSFIQFVAITKKVLDIVEELSLWYAADL